MSGHLRCWKCNAIGCAGMSHVYTIFRFIFALELPFPFSTQPQVNRQVLATSKRKYRATVESAFEIEHIKNAKREGEKSSAWKTKNDTHNYV